MRALQLDARRWKIKQKDGVYFLMNSIKITHEIPIERVQDLICNALEGGYSSEWCQIERYEYPIGETKESLKIEFQHIELPFKGGTIIFKDISGEGDGKREYALDFGAICNGLQIMADKETKHFADFMQENDDAITGDVLLQCCLFKEVIYG